MNSNRLADLIAGLSIAGLLLPEAVAYSSIARLPPQAGVIALFVGLTVYALFGSSRFAIVSATSSSAAVLAAASLSLSVGDPALRNALAFGLVIVTGVFILGASAVRLGNFSDFIAKSVLRGFAFGLAIVIIIKQMPIVLGVGAHHDDLPRYVMDLVAQYPQWNLAQIGCCGLALALLYLFGRFRRVPGALIVIVLGILATEFLDLASHGISTVGEIALTINIPGLPTLSRDSWLRLGEIGFAMVLVLYAESSSSIRSFAILHGDRVEPNRDLFALGVANLVSGLLQGMPVGAGYSATSANEAAGAQSRLAGGIAAAVLLVVVAFVLPLVALTPAPILAAIVIHAVSHTLSIERFKPYFLWQRDRVVAVAAVLAVLALGVLDGLLAAVAISLIMLLMRLSQSKLAELGRLANSHDFVDLRLHKDARAPDSVLVLRPEAPLFFANADRMLGEVRHRYRDSKAQAVVLSLEESQDLDGTAIEALQLLADDVARDGRLLVLARLKEPVIELLLRARLANLAPECFRYYSVDDAVAAAQAVRR